MEKQERKQEPKREPQSKEEVKANPKVIEAGKKLKEDIDKLVDEIDDVLEKNAEEFVKNYVQKGGEESESFLDVLFLRPRLFLPVSLNSWFFVRNISPDRSRFLLLGDQFDKGVWRHYHPIALQNHNDKRRIVG